MKKIIFLTTFILFLTSYTAICQTKELPKHEKYKILENVMGDTTNKKDTTYGQKVKCNQILVKCFNEFQTMMQKHQIKNSRIGKTHWLSTFKKIQAITTREGFSQPGLLSWIEEISTKYDSNGENTGKNIYIYVEFGLYNECFFDNNNIPEPTRIKKRHRFAIFLTPYKKVNGEIRRITKENLMASALGNVNVKKEDDEPEAFDLGDLQP